MDRRRTLQVAALAWALIGAAVALSSLSSVNEDARTLAWICSIGGPLAAIGASALLRAGADRAAGGLLLVSVLTPTYFAYPLNLPALVGGLALVAVPRLVLPNSATSPRWGSTRPT